MLPRDTNLGYFPNLPLFTKINNHSIENNIVFSLEFVWKLDMDL